MKKKTTLALLLLSTFQVHAQKQKQVEGKAEMRMEDSYCVGTMKRQAEDMAKIDALQKEFGTVVSQGTNYYLESKSGQKEVSSSMQFNVISNTLVMGEWIETRSVNSKWTIREIEGKQELWYVCEISGKAKEVSSTPVDFEVQAMNCDEAKKCSGNMFSDGDDLYVSFKAAKEGFLSIFLEEKGTVYRLFPYKRMAQKDESSSKVSADLQYVFFSSKQAGPQFGFSPSEVDEFRLETTTPQTFDRIFVLYSEKPHGKPIFEQTKDIPSLALADFQKWLNKAQSGKEGLQVKHLDISISKK